MAKKQTNTKIGAPGAENLAGVLGQCRLLAHLNLHRNNIGAAGAKCLAGVLAQCAALAHLDLSSYRIGENGPGGFAGVMAQYQRLTSILGTLDIMRENADAQAALTDSMG